MGVAAESGSANWKKVLGAVKAGKQASAKVPQGANCRVDLHGTFAIGCCSPTARHCSHLHLCGRIVRLAGPSRRDGVGVHRADGRKRFRGRLSKRGRRWRYYVSQAILQGSREHLGRIAGTFMRSSSASEINRLYAYWLFLPAFPQREASPNREPDVAFPAPKPLLGQAV